MDRSHQQQSHRARDRRQDQRAREREDAQAARHPGAEHEQQRAQARESDGNGRARNGERSQQPFDRRTSAGRHADAVTEVAFRGAAMLWDMQLDTARTLWRTQARTARMFGLPDYSALFGIGDHRARRIFSAGAEQLLSSARHARETVTEVQRQIGRIAEQQAIAITEEVQQQVEQMGREAEDRLNEIKEIAVAEGDELEDLAKETRERAEDEAQSQREPRDEEALQAALVDQAAGNEESEAHGERRARRAG